MLTELEPNKGIPLSKAKEDKVCLKSAGISKGYVLTCRPPQKAHQLIRDGFVRYPRGFECRGRRTSNSTLDSTYPRVSGKGMCSTTVSALRRTQHTQRLHSFLLRKWAAYHMICLMSCTFWAHFSHAAEPCATYGTPAWQKPHAFVAAPCPMPCNKG